MTNDQFLLFPMLSYGYKNTVGAVAHLFFSDPPFAPHATKGRLWPRPSEHYDADAEDVQERGRWKKSRNIRRLELNRWLMHEQEH